MRPQQLHQQKQMNPIQRLDTFLIFLALRKKEVFHISEIPFNSKSIENMKGKIIANVSHGRYRLTAAAEDQIQRTLQTIQKIERPLKTL